MDKQYDLDNEIEIDLKSLLLQLLSSWKIIFLAAVIAGGLVYIRALCTHQEHIYHKPCGYSDRIITYQ